VVEGVRLCAQQISDNNDNNNNEMEETHMLPFRRSFFYIFVLVSLTLTLFITRKI